jgi:hypothetical protein
MDYPFTGTIINGDNFSDTTITRTLTFPKLNSINYYSNLQLVQTKSNNTIYPNIAVRVSNSSISFNPSSSSGIYTVVNSANFVDIYYSSRI